MKCRILIITTILFAFLSVCKSNNKDDKSSFSDIHGKLSVKGTALIDRNGDTLVMKGVSFGWHNWWPAFYNSKTIDWLKKDWNCNLVRAAIGVEPAGGYLTNRDFANQCLDTVIDAAIKNGIYVIADWHSHGIRTDGAKEFFTRIAEKYKDYPNIIYELFNEPVAQTWEEIKSCSEEIIKTIRAIDKDNIILVGSPHWDQDIHIAADNPLQEYKNIMYTLHFYAATHKQSLRDRADYALKKGLPIFVSECAGMEASGNGAIDSASWNEWTQWMQKNHLSWIAWSVSPKDETCSMIKDVTVPASGWSDEDLKLWGQIVKNELNTNCKK